MNDTPRLIVTRHDPEPHYEVHYAEHVEFWTVDGRKLGESPVYQHE